MLRTSNLSATRDSSGSGGPEMNAPFVDRSRTTAGKRWPTVEASASTRRNTAARFGWSFIATWPIDSTIAGALTTRRAARRSSDIASIVSAHAGPRRDLAIDRRQSEDPLLAGCEQHPLGPHPAQRDRLEVRDDDHRLADERVRRIALGDPRDD